MEEELKLNDIADDLLILNKMTIDTLFKLDNCADCIALYVFYYKTAKWQKTNTIKANDLYIKKSLKWGAEKIKRTKNTLKEHGLINIIQRRKEGKIEGWYIEVSYLVTQKKIEDIKIKVEQSNNSQNEDVESSTTLKSNNSQNQQVENPTSDFEDINALKENIKSLNKEIEMLKNNNIKMLKNKNKVSKKESKKTFDEMIDEYTLNDDLKIELKNHLQTRKAKKATLTNRAIELSFKKLDDLVKTYPVNIQDEMKIKIVQKSIENGWTSFYELKEGNYTYNQNKSFKTQNKSSGWDYINEEYKKTVNSIF